METNLHVAARWLAEESVTEFWTDILKSFVEKQIAM